MRNHPIIPLPPASKSASNAILAASLALATLAGCQQEAGPRKPTQKESATRQWNATRAAVLVGLAADQYHGGNFDQARQTVSEALKLDPKNAPLRVLSAKVAIEQGQLELAEKELALAREYNPADAESDYLGGVIYQRWQKPDLALGYYTRACEKAPAELAYLMAKGETLVALDRMAEALLLLQEKVVYFENNASLRDAVGQLLMQEGKYAKAAEMLRQASILANDDLPVREHLALALYHDSQWAACAEVLGRLVKDPRYASRADLLTALGECQLQQGKLREARETFVTASALEPGFSGIWLSLAKAALQMNDARRAELSLKKSLSLDPSGAEANLLLGYLRLRQDRLDEALACFHKASALDRNDPLCVCLIGYVMEKQGRGDEAIRHYGKALKIKPGDDLANKLMSSVQLQE